MMSLARRFPILMKLFPTLLAEKESEGPFARGKNAIDKIIVFKKGEIILEQGRESLYAYFIKNGSVRIFRTNKGQDIDIAVLLRGQIFGEMALIKGYRHSANAAAAEDVELVPITMNLMNRKLAKTDPLIHKILTSLIERLYNETFTKEKP